MRRKNVIFIDDDPDAKYLAERAISRLDCEFLFFERVTDVFSSIEWINPRLIVVDLMMTNMQGVYEPEAGMQVAANIRGQFGEKFPILILTGSDSPQTISKCLRSGADDYYVKSHDFVGLIKRIASWLVVDYSKTNARYEREAAAEALENLMAQKQPPTVREWRNFAVQEIFRIEKIRAEMRFRRPISDPLAWNRAN